MIKYKPGWNKRNQSHFFHLAWNVLYCWAVWRWKHNSYVMGGIHLIILVTYCACSAHLHPSLCLTASLTVQHGLVQTPVDTQAVLLLLHASFTLAATERGGQQRRHGIFTLVSRPRAQLHAAIPRHTLPKGAQSWAAGVITGAGVSCTQAVPPTHGERHTWDSYETDKASWVTFTSRALVLTSSV